MRKIFGGVAALALAVGILATGPAQAVSPTWDTTGNYVWSFEYQSNFYPHNVTLAQDSSGNLTGNGSSGAYMWTIDSGTVSGNSITFSAHYTATADAVTPLTTMNVTGTVAGDGTISGTWTDNYQGNTRNGTFTTVSGNATPITSTGLTFSVNPRVYDPDNLGTAVAQWQTIGGSNPDRNMTYPTDKNDCKDGGWQNSTYQPPFKNQGQCVSYAVNNPANVGGNQVLVLQKNDVTSANEAAVADITGEEGTVLTSLGFDYKTGTYCGAGAPRFDVFISDTEYYFFGCTYGTHTDLGNGWTRVTFSNADAVQVGPTAFPGFGSTTVGDIQIVMDEQGQAMLDNIMINGTMVGGQ